MERTLRGLEGFPRERRAPGERPLDSIPRRSTSLARGRRCRASRSTRTTAPRRSSSTRPCASPTRTTSPSASTPMGSTRPPSSRTRSRRSRAARSTPITSRAPAAATSRTSSRLVREPNVICSSTTPTIPWGVSAVDEGLRDDDPQPRRVVRRSRRTWRSSGSGSTRRRWPPRVRSTSSARSRSSTRTRRAWAGSRRRSGGPSSWPTRCRPGDRPRRDAAIPACPPPTRPPRRATTRPRCSATWPR